MQFVKKKIDKQSEKTNKYKHPPHTYKENNNNTKPLKLFCLL